MARKPPIRVVVHVKGGLVDSAWSDTEGVELLIEDEDVAAVEHDGGTVERMPCGYAPEGVAANGSAVGHETMRNTDALGYLRLMTAIWWDKASDSGRYMLVLCRRAREREAETGGRLFPLSGEGWPLAADEAGRRGRRRRAD